MDHQAPDIKSDQFARAVIAASGVVLFLALLGCDSINDRSARAPLGSSPRTASVPSLRPEKPTKWKPAASLTLKGQLFRLGAAEQEVQSKLGEPIEFETTPDPDVRVELPSETVSSIEIVNCYYADQQWVRITLRRDVPRRPYVVRWKGYNDRGKFVVSKFEVGVPTMPVPSASGKPGIGYQLVPSVMKKTGRPWMHVVLKKTPSEQELIDFARQLHAKYPTVRFNICDDPSGLRQLDRFNENPTTAPFPERWAMSHYVAMINVIIDQGQWKWRLAGCDAHPTKRDQIIADLSDQPIRPDTR